MYGLSDLTTATPVLALVSVLAILLLSPFPGHLNRFWNYWRSRNIEKGPSSFIHSLHVNKGQNVVRIGKNEFSVTDPELVKTIYGDRDFVKSDQYAAFDFNGEQSIFSMRDPEEHDRRVKSVRGMFRQSEVARHKDIIKDKIETALSSILMDSSEEDLNVLALMRGFSVQVISHFALGETYQAHGGYPMRVGKDFGLVIDEINKSSTFGRSTAWIVQKYDTAAARIRSVLRKLRIGETSVDNNKSRPALDQALAHYSEYCSKIANDIHNDAEYKVQLSLLDISTAALETEIADLLFAGTDSTATTLSAALWHIYSSSDILETLRDDLAYVDDDQLASRPYLSAVIDETLRISPPVPRRLPRIVPKNKDIFYAEDKHDDDWHKILPAGSTVGISAYSLHRNAVVFQDPETFRPSRWLTKDSETRQRMRDHFVPFSKGVRACIGQELARSELRFMIKAFVERFDGHALGKKLEYDDHFNASLRDGAVMLKLKKRA